MSSENISSFVNPAAGNPDRIFDPDQNLFNADEDGSIDSDWYQHILRYNMNDFIWDIDGLNVATDNGGGGGEGNEEEQKQALAENEETEHVFHQNQDHQVPVNPVGVEHRESEFKNVCLTCVPSKVFASRNNLTRHITVVHLKRRPFRCSTDGCDRRFPDAYNLQVHQMAKHTAADGGGGNQSKPFPCVFPNCGRSYGYKSTLLKHQTDMKHNQAAQPEAAAEN